MQQFSIVIIGLALVPAILAGQNTMRRSGDSASAPIRDVHYDVTFMRGNAQQRAIDVVHDDRRRPGSAIASGVDAGSLRDQQLRALGHDVRADR